ncbi:MAG TPA: hypothetical protein V6D23_22685 [Candidatus Obscuribacterales bacterium]
MLLLLTSYYLIKPLRSSYLYREFDPETLRYFFLVTPVVSLLVTRVFNWFYGRLPKFFLVCATYLVIIAFKVFFTFALPLSGKLTIPYAAKGMILFFYFWNTVYFLLAISILWGCVSTIFNSKAAERVFAFIAFGSMAGALVGSKLSEYLAASAYKGQTLLVSAFTMGLTLVCLALAIRHTPDYSDAPPAPKADLQGKSRQHTLAQDLRNLWQRHYIRCIGIMVFALAFMSTTVEFRSQISIDHKLAEQAYLKEFAPLNDWLCKQQSCNGGVAAGAFERVLTLRREPQEQRQAVLGKWLKANAAPFEAEQMSKAYEGYQETLDGLTHGYLASINFWTNLFGVTILLLVARPLFRYLGLKQVLIQLPLVFMVVGALLFFPIDLSIMGIILIITGTLNYSLNKTGKELLYTQADDEARFRFKPLIDGPGMRLGDVSVAILSILCLDLLHLGDGLATPILLAVGLLVTLWWFWSSWQVGNEYKEIVKQREAEAASQDSVQPG